MSTINDVCYFSITVLIIVSRQLACRTIEQQQQQQQLLLLLLLLLILLLLLLILLTLLVNLERKQLISFIYKFIYCYIYNMCVCVHIILINHWLMNAAANTK
jgi:uncharacterized membrane protein